MIVVPVINIPGRAGIATNADNATNATKLKNDYGIAPSYSCRAWVNFNGTGTVAIRASSNVSSITDNGVGDYTVNFTNAMPDANFCVSLSIQDEATGYAPPKVLVVPNSGASVRVGFSSSGSAFDNNMYSVAIFR